MLALVYGETDYLATFYLWVKHILFGHTEEVTPLLGNERDNYWQMIQPIHDAGIDNVTANRIRYELTSLEENTEAGRQDYSYYTLAYYK